MGRSRSAKWPIRLRVTAGASRDSPRAIVRTPSTSCAGGVSLREPAGAGAKCLVHVLVDVERGDDQHLHRCLDHRGLPAGGSPRCEQVVDIQRVLGEVQPQPGAGGSGTPPCRAGMAWEAVRQTAEVLQRHASRMAAIRTSSSETVGSASPTEARARRRRARTDAERPRCRDRPRSPPEA